MASITGLSGCPYVTGTSVAQTALIRHAEGLAAASGAGGVKAFAIHPGIVRTELLAGYLDSPEGERYLTEWRALPEDAFSSPEVCGALVVRIAQGALDGLSGRFIDATTDIDALLARSTGAPLDDQLTLRLVPLA
jgi:NAD(P)-dependent dehydrogenase (short-subunit alcohol dehydrogenase family)